MEFIAVTDNRARTLGMKRNAMMQMAQGRYLCHVDDDEMLAPDFFATLLPYLDSGVDVIGYDAAVSFNGGPEFRVTTSLHGPNTQPQALGGERYSDATRTYWHWCTWRTDLVRDIKFPEHYSATEDADWLARVLPLVKKHWHIDRQLFFHRYDRNRTSFPPIAGGGAGS